MKFKNIEIFLTENFPSLFEYNELEINSPNIASSSKGLCMHKLSNFSNITSKKYFYISEIINVFTFNNGFDIVDMKVNDICRNKKTVEKKDNKIIHSFINDKFNLFEFIKNRTCYQSESIECSSICTYIKPDRTEIVYDKKTIFKYYTIKTNNITSNILKALEAIFNKLTITSDVMEGSLIYRLVFHLNDDKCRVEYVKV